MITLGMVGPWQIILILCAFLIPIIALIDIVKNDFTKNNKLIWIIVLIAFNIFGALLYFMFGTQQKIKKLS